MDKIAIGGYLYGGSFLLFIASIGTNYFDSDACIIWSIWGASFIILSGLLAKEGK